MSYWRSAQGILRIEGENNESLYNKFGVTSRIQTMWSGGQVKRNTISWFGDIERVTESEMIK